MFIKYIFYLNFVRYIKLSFKTFYTENLLFKFLYKKTYNIYLYFKNLANIKKNDHFLNSINFNKNIYFLSLNGDHS